MQGSERKHVPTERPHRMCGSGYQKAAKLSRKLCDRKLCGVGVGAVTTGGTTGQQKALADPPAGFVGHIKKGTNPPIALKLALAFASST